MVACESVSSDSSSSCCVVKGSCGGPKSGPSDDIVDCRDGTSSAGLAAAAALLLELLPDAVDGPALLLLVAASGCLRFTD